jgi:hypothetical protein
MNIHTKDAETLLTTFTDIVSDTLPVVILYVSLGAAQLTSGTGNEPGIHAPFPTMQYTVPPDNYP